MTEGVLTASSRLWHPSFNQVPCTLGLVSSHDRQTKIYRNTFSKAPDFPSFLIYKLPLKKNQTLRTATLLRNRVDPRPQLFIIHYSLFIKISRLGLSVFQPSTVYPRHCRRYATKPKILRQKQAGIHRSARHEHTKIHRLKYPETAALRFFPSALNTAKATARRKHGRMMRR